MVHTNCSVYGCESTSKKNKDLKFHRFPRDARCHLWIEACRRPDLRDKNVDQLYNMHVCGLHFEGWMYMKKKLKSAAIPVLNLPSPMYIEVLSRAPPTNMPYVPNYPMSYRSETQEITIVKDSPDDDVQKHMETDPLSSPVMPPLGIRTIKTRIKLSDNTPRKRKLLKQLISCHKKMKATDDNKPTSITRQQFLQGCDKFLSPSLSKVAKAQTDLKPYSKNNRYSKEFKLFCVSIYCSSPHAYKFLSNTLGLPSKRALITTAVPMGTKISDYVLGLLARAAESLTPSESECTVCVGGMSLKCSLFYDAHRDKVIGLHEVDADQRLYAAEYAFVIMLRGILADWVQLVGYAFVTTNRINGQIQKWITNTTRQLLASGFKVRAIVSDLRSDFLKFSESMGVSIKEPYMEIDGRKVYCIYDVPRLLKCVRNDFMNHNFEFDGKTATWDDIYNCYQLDKGNYFRFAPKLTDAHAAPKDFQKRNVRLAVQVFSDTVKTALKAYSKSGDLNPCDGTIEFVDTMDKLFDLLNSTTVLSPNPYKKPYRDTETQCSLLLKAKNLLSGLIVRRKTDEEDVTASTKFVGAFSITINAVMQLYEDLKKESGSDEFYLTTRRLNKEGLENFFGVVRRAGCKDGAASCIQFERAFRKSFLCQLFLRCGKNMGSDDFDGVLSRYGDFVISKPLFSNGDASGNLTGRTLSKNFHIPKQNSFLYICSYVLRRCIDKHRCPSMLDYVSRYSDEPTANNSYVQQTAASATCDSLDGGLQVPPPDFVEYCIELEVNFKKNFYSFMGSNVSEKLFELLNKIEFKSRPCACFPQNFLLKLFIQIRIYYIVKINNSKLRMTRNKISRHKHLTVQHL